MWRLRKRNPGRDVVTNHELWLAITYEIGTDAVTYERNRKVMLKLGWLKVKGTQHVILTDKDLTDS